MNSQTFRHTAPTSRFRNARAQYSPLRRHTTSAATLGFQRDAGLGQPRASSNTGAADPTLRWWDPHLVDRLQPPLTRFRE